MEKHHRAAQDNALASFLEVLVYLRRVLLQDVAALVISHGSNLSLLKYKPFNSPAFAEFIEVSRFIIEKAESEAREQLKNLPDAIAQSFSGALESLKIEQQKERQASAQRDHDLRSDIAHAMMYRSQPGPSSSKKRRVQTAELQDIIKGIHSHCWKTIHPKF